MSDAARREAERGAAGGDPQAAARLLVARRRSGDLPACRLELAAYLGDPAACLALGREPAPVTVLGAWADGLAAWGDEARARACVAAVAAIVPAWRSLWPADERLPAAAEALRRSLARPGQLEAARAQLLALPRPHDAPERMDDAVRAVWLATSVLEALHGGGPRGTETSEAIRAAAGAWGGGLGAFIAALRADLLPWVLGAPAG